MTMHRNTKLLLAAAVAAVFATGVRAFLSPQAPDVAPAIPAKPAESPVTLLLARPFVLDSQATHWWRKEQPKYDAGIVVVLGVDPALVHPRQSAEPVLYVGHQTGERVNAGHESGRVVCVVPAAKNADGSVALALGSAPIFFGAPDLPERVDAARIEQEVAAAIRAGAQAPSAAAIESALQPQVSFADDYELRLYCADLVAQYSPTEIDLVNGIRAPKVGK